MTIGQSAEEDLSFLLINVFVPIINPIETHFKWWLLYIAYIASYSSIHCVACEIKTWGSTKLILNIGYLKRKKAGSVLALS